MNFVPGEKVHNFEQKAVILGVIFLWGQLRHDVFNVILIY